MPAPPEESEPAIIRIFDLSFNYLILFEIIFIHFNRSLLFSLSPITLIFDSVQDFLTNILPFPFISFSAILIDLLISNLSMMALSFT